jgi:hypothetical protein
MHQLRNSCHFIEQEGSLPFTYCSQLKFLGLYITEHLDWKSHIQDLLLNLSRIYYIIKSLKDTVSLQIITAIYFAHFEARLQYGILFWGHDSDCTKLFCLQKKVIRLISGMKRFESCRNDFKTFKILTVTSLYILEALFFV